MWPDICQRMGPELDSDVCSIAPHADDVHEVA